MTMGVLASRLGAGGDERHIGPRAAWFTACLCLVASGCSDTASPSAPSPLPSPNTLEAVAPCTDSLDNLQKLSYCPASFAPATDGPNQLCRRYGDGFQIGVGTAHSFIVYRYGAGATDCVYDASSSALVGMWVGDDENSFCNGTSGAEAAGDLGEADWAPETFRNIDCSDSDLPPLPGSASPAPLACPGGTAPTLLMRTAPHELSSFALGGSDVYWAEPDGIWYEPKAGANALPVIEDGYAARVVGSDAEALYWSKSPEGSSPPSLFRLPFGSRAEPARVVDDASHVWTVSASQIYYLSSNGQLRAVPTAGGTSTLLSEGPWSSLALAADATGIYWTSDPPSTAAEPISKYTFATGSVTAFAPATGGARFVQTAGDRVLWADAAGVWSSTPNGERTSLSSAASVRGLASDGTRVYWAQSSGPDDVFSDILRLPLAGGDPQTIACHVYAVASLRADEAAVYYDATVHDVIGKIPLQ